MSGIGFQEVFLLTLIGLIVLGPARLPKVANQVGTWLGQARRMTRVMKRQLEEELDLEGNNISSPPPTKTPIERFEQEPEVEEIAAAPEDHEPANEHNDTWSPAHGEDEIGTGVGDEAQIETVAADDEQLDEPLDERLEEEPNKEAVS